MRKFDSLSEREMLALAISLEENDERTYADYAERLPVALADFALLAALGAFFDRGTLMDAPTLSWLLCERRSRFGPFGALYGSFAPPVGVAGGIDSYPPGDRQGERDHGEEGQQTTHAKNIGVTGLFL